MRIDTGFYSPSISGDLLLLVDHVHVLGLLLYTYTSRGQRHSVP